MAENRRLVRLLVAAPLCLLALALALVAFNSQGEPAELAAKAVTQTAGLQVPAWGPPSRRRTCAPKRVGLTFWHAGLCATGARAQARQGVCSEDHRERQAAQAPASAGKGRKRVRPEVHAPDAHQSAPGGCCEEDLAGPPSEGGFGEREEAHVCARCQEGHRVQGRGPQASAGQSGHGQQQGAQTPLPSTRAPRARHILCER